MMNKYIIKVDTYWCGTDQSYAAIAKSEEDLYDLAQELAYENLTSLDYINWIADELFDEYDDLTDEMLDKIYDVESDYYHYLITKVNEENEEDMNINNLRKAETFGESFAEKNIFFL